MKTEGSIASSQGSVLITGASSGIGYALAFEAARRGFDLLLVARRTERLVHLKSEIQSRHGGIRVELLTADVAGTTFPEKLIAALSTQGPLRFAFVNAGAPAAGRFDKLSVEDFQRNLDVNVLGAIKTAQASLSALKASCGRLVFIGSMNGHVPLPLGSPYNVSKFAVRGLAETLRVELASEGVGVTLVSPGPVKTEILAKNNRGEVVSGSSLGGGRGLDAEVAAKRIFVGAKLGLRDFTLDPGSMLLMFISRHFPNLTSILMRFFYGRFRKVFLKLVGEVNPDAV